MDQLPTIEANDAVDALLRLRQESFVIPGKTVKAAWLRVVKSYLPGGHPRDILTIEVAVAPIYRDN